MRSFTVICLLAVMAGAYGRPDMYTDRYDNVNLDEILGNQRILMSYANCLLDKATCTPEGKELKERVRDGLETECEKCTEKQKGSVNRVMGHLINKEPKIWKELTDKYDPDKKFASRYEKRLQEIKANN